MRRGVGPGQGEDLPPLLTLERFMFRMVAAGFVLLTLTLVSGAFFSEQLFGRPMTFNHKNLFSLLGWLAFAVLLFGRWRYGWRGRPAAVLGRWAEPGCSSWATSAASSCSEIVLGR